MKATITATLSPRDWVRVIHAVDSSMTRKAKRGDRDGASEMELIGRALIRQCRPQRAGEKQKGEGR